MYVLFPPVLLLLVQGNYKASVNGTETNNNLYTATSYITTRFHQQTRGRSCVTGGFSGHQSSLFFRERISQKDYCTYIYFYEGALKELFTAADSHADLSMGTSLAQLSDFQIENIEDTFFRITLEDRTGHTSTFFLHPGLPANGTSDNWGGKHSMKKITTHSKTSLFLMKCYLSCCFLDWPAAYICVQLFASSYLYRTNAREYNHIQELLTSVGEITEGTELELPRFLIPYFLTESQMVRPCAIITTKAGPLFPKKKQFTR